MVIPPPAPVKFSAADDVPFNVILVKVGCVTVPTVKDGLVPVTLVFNPLASVIDEAGLELVMERAVPVPFAIEMPVPAVKFVATLGADPLPPIVMPELVPPAVPSATEVTPSLVIVTAPVPLDTLMPVPATAEVTPVLEIVTALPTAPAVIPAPEAVTDSTALLVNDKSPPMTDAVIPVPVVDTETTALPVSATAPPVVKELMPVPEADTEVIPLPDGTTLQLGASVVGTTLRLGCSAW